MSNHSEKALFAACIVEQGLIALMHKVMLWLDKIKANIVIKMSKEHKIWHFNYFSFIFQQATKQVMNIMAKNIRNIFSITKNLRSAKQTGYNFFPVKLRKEYIKAIYCHSAYLTYMHCTLCKMLAWMTHKLESRLLGEISTISNMQMISL